MANHKKIEPLSYPRMGGRILFFDIDAEQKGRKRIGLCPHGSPQQEEAQLLVFHLAGLDLRLCGTHVHVEAWALLRVWQLLPRQEDLISVADELREAAESNPQVPNKVLAFPYTPSQWTYERLEKTLSVWR